MKELAEFLKALLFLFDKLFFAFCAQAALYAKDKH